LTSRGNELKIARTRKAQAMNKLVHILRAAGQKPLVINQNIVVLPFGGRVLGLYPEPEINVIWVNPLLESPGGARKFFAGKGWLNSGGDRSWIAPEVETHIGNENSAATYAVPRTIDPGAYKVVKTGNGFATLSTVLIAPFRRSGGKIRLRLTKTVRALKRAPVKIPPGVSYCGYRLESVLKLAGRRPAGLHPGLWNIMQVPGGGQIIVPVKGRGRPVGFIGRPRYKLGAGLITCRVKAKESFKFSLKAGHCAGLMLCLNRSGSRSTLLARRFGVFAEDNYRDVPFDDPSAIGHVQQFYVDDGQLGQFGEMEYHAPALGIRGRPQTTDVSETWAFAGPRRAIGAIAKDLINRTRK
jgi:hypothetical protein